MVALTFSLYSLDNVLFFKAIFLFSCNFLKFLKLISKYIFSTFVNGFFTKFLIYRDLRNHGYVVKNGFGFDSDFLVYTKGHFGKNGAKYLVFALNEGTQKKIGYIQKNIEQITKMGKEPIIAVIERRGEVIYYKISKIDFLENKIKSQVQDFDF